MPYENQTTEEEMKVLKRECHSTSCHKTAWFEDWTGSHWCWYHAYFNGRWSGGSKWFWFKTLKLRFPYE